MHVAKAISSIFYTTYTLCPDELVSYPKAQMSFRVDHNFSKEWIFAIRPVHNLREVDFSLYVRT